MAASVIYCGICGTRNAGNERYCHACGSSLAPSSARATALSASIPTGQIQAQTLLKGRYRVLQRVGKGGMGAVYLAQDIQLGDRPVAVKEMSQSSLFDQQLQSARENFKREAHMLASLQHPNLPSIHDYFEEDGRWYLVMSFIQGQTLEDYLGPNQRLSVEETLTIAQELCNVLSYLHAHQPPIIFRDLKPSNIMRSVDGHLYLIDFGIARHFKPGQTRDTASYGSMGYSPPEQYGQAQTTERSDIYSLGVTLYQCLSGFDPASAPFRLPPLSALVPTLPERLIRLITRMTELDGTRRPSNIKIVQQELQQIAANPYNVLAPPPPPLPVTPFPPTQYVAPPIPYPLDQQTSAQLQQEIHRVPTPAQSALARVGKILTIIGMIIGGLIALFGLAGALTALGDPPAALSDVTIGGLIGFFGLLIFFLVCMRKTVFPVTSRRKRKVKIGRIILFISILYATILIISGILYFQDHGVYVLDLSDTIAYNILTIIIGIGIWLSTRIWCKKAP